jgi:hypothetical protein
MSESSKTIPTPVFARIQIPGAADGKGRKGRSHSDDKRFRVDEPLPPDRDVTAIARSVPMSLRPVLDGKVLSRYTCRRSRRPAKTAIMPARNESRKSNIAV